ncbi:MAG: hypothetical protein QM765_44935 [Myxococcales bacterium]
MDLAISIAIDPLAMVRQPPVTPPPAPKPPEPAPAQLCPSPQPCPACPEAAPAPRPPSPAPAPVEPSEPWQLQAHVGPVAAVGASPDLGAFGVSLGLEVRKGLFLLGVEGRADFPSKAAVAGGAVSTSLLTASVVPCGRLSYFGLCVALTGGVQRANGENLPAARAVTSPYFAAGPRLLFEIPLTGRFSVRADAEVKGTFARTTVLVGDQPVWTTPAVTGALGLSALFCFL